MNRERVVILHGAVPENAPKDEQDVLDEVEVVHKALTELGYEVSMVPLTLDLAAVIQKLKAIQPKFVFNLTESVEGQGQLIHFGPTILEYLGLPFTGCSRDAIYVTSNKLMTKKILDCNGIATPEWVSLRQQNSDQTNIKGTFIIKAVWEHASVDLDDDSVVEVNEIETLITVLKERQKKKGKEFFAERYIDGREFNLAILAGEVQPIPEMKFYDFPAGTRKMVSYRAKWEEGSFEYQHTSRTFDLDRKDRPLLNRMTRIGQKCWKAFELRGYARVDFRVDRTGKPWVLEINANPCITMGSGFFVASEKKGYTYNQVIAKIIQGIAVLNHL